MTATALKPLPARAADLVGKVAVIVGAGRESTAAALPARAADLAGKVAVIVGRAARARRPRPHSPPPASPWPSQPPTSRASCGERSPGELHQEAYDMVAQGFGEGANGPLTVVAELPGRDARDEVALAGTCASGAPRTP
jgi:hypothetical protein